MENEQARTMDGLQLAIQMEIDGKIYYQNASKNSVTRVGRELFEWLAIEEDKHRKRFEQIYSSIKDKKVWPKVDINPIGEEKLADIFSRAMEETSSKVKASSDEQDAISNAMDMETRTQEFYKKQSGNATYETERKFYETLASEERGHYLALVDYKEYILDPTGWFTKMEHPTLDGG
ncbi:ferritin family protein [Chloroflexota bacterium]